MFTHPLFIYLRRIFYPHYYEASRSTVALVIAGGQ